jgi:hypothetical protein
MNVEKQLTQWMGMDEETWQKHANPQSVFSRILVLPLMLSSIWSRKWLGWKAVFPFALTMLWNWFNPRLFDKPKSTDNWAPKAVFGESVWLKKDEEPIPERHKGLPEFLNAVNTVGLFMAIIGAFRRQGWVTSTGAAMNYLAKFWFLDRMVWLFNEQQQTHKKYNKWIY